jgi:hypothetical protein
MSFSHARSESVGDRCNDASFLLGSYRIRRDRQSGCLLDGQRETWKPAIKFVKAKVDFFEEAGWSTLTPQENGRKTRGASR